MKTRKLFLFNVYSSDKCDGTSSSPQVLLTSTIMGPSSSDALYQPIPQAPIASLPVLSGPDENDAEEGENPASDVHIDIRVKWIYFMLGAAVLLPWNGASFHWWFDMHTLIRMYHSFNHCYPIFPFATSRLTSTEHIQLLFVNLIHCYELLCACACDRDVPDSS